MTPPALEASGAPGHRHRAELRARGPAGRPRPDFARRGPDGIAGGDNRLVNPTIRIPAPDEAGAVTRMLCKLDRENSTMMLEPGERSDDPRLLQEWLSALHPDHHCYLVVFDGSRALGFVHAERGPFRRNRHSAYVVIGLLEEARGRGWGRRLLEAVDQWATERGVSRLELTVMAHNAAAIGLYRRCGYVEEGLRRHSLIVDGTPVDEFAMAKMLNPER